MLTERKIERLQQLKNDLESITVQSFADWENIKSWARKATPIFINDWKEFVEEFKNVTKSPNWMQFPRVGGGVDAERYNSEARTSEYSANFSIVVGAKKDILEFLNGILILNSEPKDFNLSKNNMDK